MNKLLSLFSLLFSLFSFAQIGTGTLNTVSENGLHSIQISPEIRSNSKNNLDFIRVFDSKKNEVPYVSFQKKQNKLSSLNFKIIAQNSIANKLTSVIIENPVLNKKINNLTLEIANTELEKTYNILGSNDQNNWFGLVNNQIVSDLFEENKTSVEHNFTFPLNNYKYLKFEFIDKNSLPIHVLSAFIEENNSINNELIELTNFQQKITTNSKNKTTEININFTENQVINGINFEIVAPNLYLRNAQLTINKTRKYKHQTENYQETLTSFELNSKTKNQFHLSEIFEKKFTIQIENQDNQPLDIRSIQLFQKPLNIVADLKTNEKYSIVIDTTLKTPNYDLANFETNFNKELPTVAISNFKATQIAENKTDKPFWETPLFMWICIAFAVLVVGYFAVSMLKDV